MVAYDFAHRVNAVEKADTEHKISVSQAAQVLLALESDPQLAADVGRHLYGEAPPPAEPDVELPAREVVDILDANNA